MTVYFRGVNLVEISARHGPQIVLFGPARLGINILYYKICTMGFNIFFVGTKTYENFVKYGYNLWFNSCTIADLLKYSQKKILFLEF